MRDRFPLLLVAGLLVAGALGAALLQGSRRGDFADVLSTYRSTDKGARALYLLAEESGVPVVRRTQDLAVLEGTHGVVLLGVDVEGEEDRTPEETELAEGADAGVSPRDGLNPLFASPLDKTEHDALLEHVKRGATVVYAPWGARENPFLDALGVELRRASSELGPRTLLPAGVTPFTRGVEKVEAPVQAYLRLRVGPGPLLDGEDPDAPVQLAHQRNGGPLPLLVDEELDAPVAALAWYGHGRVLVLGAPELAMNGMLGRADNAAFWLNLLAAASSDGPVHFDEFHHGFRNERSVVEFARRYGLHFAVAQLLLGLVLWAASLRRFGPPQPFAEDVRTGGMDALSATARLYRAGRHRAWAAGLLLRELVQSLGHSAGLGAHAGAREVETALRARGSTDLATLLARTAERAASAERDADVLATAEAAASARRLSLSARKGGPPPGKDHTP
ncbi:MAG: hypothetical protein L0Y66_22160 [Myxococcaceae bacterium]|nr:hypothetical protein [Myxococcaceae bacterium]